MHDLSDALQIPDPLVEEVDSSLYLFFHLQPLDESWGPTNFQTREGSASAPHKVLPVWDA